LAEAIQKEFGAKSELIPGDGGVFDVKVDGALVYSKHQTGRHIRDNDEVLDLIRELQAS
jgi:predicted Rdx family selenoprotein